MIDTDKYTGHTEGLWGCATIVGMLEYYPNEEQKSNYLLAKDAPLLLEEVKRLHKKNVEIRNEIHVALDNERMRNGANEGWLKALEYVLALMDEQEEEE